MKKISILALTLAIAAACVPDARESFMVDDSFGLSNKDLYAEASVHAGSYTVGIAKNGKGKTAASVQIKIGTQENVDAYNEANKTSYKAIDASLISLSKSSLSFEAKDVVKDVTLSWDPDGIAEFVGGEKDYVVPICIESADLDVKENRSVMLVKLIRSGVSIIQKSIGRVVNENKVKPDADGNQPELKETLTLDVEMDNAIKNVGISFPVVIDNSLIEIFNEGQETPFVAAPEGLVSLQQTMADIPESGRSCTVRLTFDKSVLLSGGELPEFPSYVIPVKLDTENASATLKGEEFDLRGLSFGNTVTYVTVTYEKILKGLSVERLWGKYASSKDVVWSSYIDGFTAGADRNVTLDDEYIYIAETNDSKNLWAISLSDPSTYKKLPVGTVKNEGTFFVSCPRVIKNTDSSLNGGKDILVVSNMHTGGDPKLYVYDKGIGEDPSVINLTTWASRRLGDTFTWWGTWQDGMLFFKDFNSAQGTVTFKTNGKVSGSLFLLGRIVAPPVNGAGAYFPFPDDISSGVSSSRGGTTAWLTSSSVDLMKLEGAHNPTLTELSGYYADTAFRFFTLGDKKYVAYTRQVSGSDGRLFILEGTPEQSWNDILLERKVVYHAAIQNESEQDGIDETPSPESSSHSGMDLDVRVKGNEAYIAVVKQRVGLSLFKLTYND